MSGEGPPRSAEDIARTREFIEKAFGRSIESRHADLEACAPLLECSKALAMTEKRLALCESLLRQLASGEPVGELVREYFDKA
jgi:hypothetical protein